ncbi:hypothetical protein MA16_Dca005766 [Dendrobium catenatum]|uniref:Uncharacterized protein n=1 Tax=Dendrobium catenatum TaxID=906689 RepID=A0A2I0WX53_9ASPA|nr:hypothetical protein MA16_Dca005766 [Dendrobium catenatum]
MIRFIVDEAGYWKVKKFIENHNHDLLRPEDRHLLRSCSSNKVVKGLFHKCFSKCDSEEEFENIWAEMIIQGNLYDHVWLHDLHRIRKVVNNLQ